MFATLEVAVEGPVGALWLNRPKRLNALSGEVLRELAAAARWFDTQSGVRVVVVGGRGRAFSAGADLDGFPSAADAGVREAADLGRLMAEALEGMRALTIARIQGWCVGGGLVLAAACDLRIAAESARFSIPEIDLGIPLAWGGIPRLVREIGPALTKELVITCREFTPQEAQAAAFLIGWWRIANWMGRCRPWPHRWRPSRRCRWPPPRATSTPLPPRWWAPCGRGLTPTAWSGVCWIPSAARRARPMPAPGVANDRPAPDTGPGIGCPGVACRRSTAAVSTAAVNKP